MYKKALLIGIVTTLMCSTTFANPWQCLRSKLHNEFGLSRQQVSTNNWTMTPPLYLPNLPNVSYGDTDQDNHVIHAFSFYHVYNTTDKGRAEVLAAPSDCGCNIQRKGNGVNEYLGGWCWDV